MLATVDNSHGLGTTVYACEAKVLSVEEKL